MAGTNTNAMSSWIAAWEVRKRPVCELMWVGLPLIAQRLSRTLSSITLDGSYLAARPGLGAFLPPFALLMGFAFGSIDGGAILYQQLPVLAAILLFASLSGSLGLLFACGYGVGDLLLGGSLAEGAAWTNAPLTIGVPMLIEYLAIGIFASQLTFISKGLAQQVPLPKGLTGNHRFGAIAVMEAVGAGLAAWGWITALPIVLRPQLVWAGLEEPGDALETTSSYAISLAAMVFLATLARLALQYRTAFDVTYRPWLNHLDELRQSVPAVKTPLVDRIPPRIILGLQALLATLMLAGMMEGWIDAFVAAAVIGTVQAARKNVLPILGRWPELADRIPAFARVLAGMAILALVGPGLLWFAFGQLSGMRPMLAVTLLSLVVFLLLLPPRPTRSTEASGSQTEPAQARA